MAGAGYKLFNTGDVLLASEVNTYLQQQTVMVFASSAARTTALSGVLAEGMMSYLQDTNSVEVYNGSSWVNVGNAGDITGVTAGTGISGGGPSEITGTLGGSIFDPSFARRGEERSMAELRVTVDTAATGDRFAALIAESLQIAQKSGVSYGIAGGL